MRTSYRWTPAYSIHAFTDFKLAGAHLDASCADCHAAGDPHRDAETVCGSCHAQDDVHGGALGSACQDCHTETTWSQTSFDHASTGFSLTGRHTETMCVDCHRDNHFAGSPTACIDCHRVDDVHSGRNGSACHDCHSTETWQQIGFDHMLETGFALVDGHGGLACNDCHTQPDFKDGLDGSCVGCHLGEDDHQGRNGTECETCHQPVEWHSTLFDHAETGFALVAAHDGLQCAACHKADTADNVPADCGGCHGVDDAHATQLGMSCGSCHGDSEWQPAAGFDHDLAAFPLIGMHATAACGTCHDSTRFHDAPSVCAACHEEDDVHAGSLGQDCGACHTSNQWSGTAFDHGKQTGFALDGAHAGAECTACHSSTSSDMSDVPSTCGGCHASDDVHDGGFGLQCSTCHDTGSFAAVERL